MSTMVARFVSCTIVTEVHFPLGCITRESVFFADEQTLDDNVQVDVREDVEHNCQSMHETNLATMVLIFERSVS